MLHENCTVQVLIAYSRGMCVLWDLKNETTEGRFSYNLSENHVSNNLCHTNTSLSMHHFVAIHTRPCQCMVMCVTVL